MFEVLSIGGERGWVDYPLSEPLGGQDLYFRPVLRDASGGMHYLTVVSDTDEERPTLKPTTVVATSPKHVWSGWTLSAPFDEDSARSFHARLDPYAPYVDWVRLPGTTSTKRPEAFEVSVKEASDRRYDLEEIRRLPVPEAHVDEIDESWLSWAPDPPVGPQQFLDGIGKKAIGRQLTMDVPFDRLVRRLMAAGLDEGQIIFVASHAKNSPFRAFRYGAAREIAKIILRMRVAASSAMSSVVPEINSIRSAKGGRSFGNRDRIAALVIRDLQSRGVFLNSVQRTPWFVEQNTGEAMSVSPYSGPIRYLISRRYGLNPVDSEHRHTLHHAVSYASNLPPTALQAGFSFYDEESHRVLFHTGGREVIVVSRDRPPSLESNGASEIIFRSLEGCTPLDIPLSRIVFDPNWWNEFCPPLFNVLNLTEEQAKDLLHVWILFVVLRNMAAERPLLGFTGQMGSGKSTLARKLYHLLYGSGRNLNQVKTEEDFNTTVSNQAVAIFDNLDQGVTPPWLANRLELATNPTDLSKRKLYSDNDTFLVQFDAVVGFTAAEPTFFRGALIDRMLILSFERIEKENRNGAAEVLDMSGGRRERFLGNLMADVQKVLRTPRPDPKDARLEFRIEDFNRIGLWVAQALGLEQQFRDALHTVARKQITLTTELDQTVIDALQEWGALCPTAGEWITPTRLWEELHDWSNDKSTFEMKYKSSSVLGRRLWGIYPHLRQLMPELESMEDPRTGWRIWRFMKKV